MQDLSVLTEGFEVNEAEDSHASEKDVRYKINIYIHQLCMSISQQEKMMNGDYTYNQSYQVSIARTLDKALLIHKRTMSVRVDLRLPNNYTGNMFPSALMTRFVQSLKAKVKVDLVHKQRAWGRNLNCEISYVWVREFGPINGKKHFHALIFVNKDVYHSLGDFSQLSGNLAAIIRQSWCSALAMPYPDYQTLVHFPVNGIVYVDDNSPDAICQRQMVLGRADYLAKEMSKHYGDGERSFGCSR